MKINLRSNNITDLPLCYQQRIVGFCYSIVLLVSASSNAIVIFTVFRNKKLHTNINYLITFLSAMNLILGCIQLPMIIANAFNCGYMFGERECVFSAAVYITNLCGIAYSLMMVSVERYFVICTPFKSFTVTGKISIGVTVGLAMISSVLWCVSPLAGWSIYKIDSGKVSCIVDAYGPYEWHFILFLACVLYCIPLTVLIYTNIAVIRKVKESGKRFANDRVKTRKLKKETFLVKVALILIASFFITGTPHLVMTILRMADRSNAYFVLLDMVSSLIVRTTILWPALINMFVNKDIKSHIFRSRKVHPLTTNNSLSLTH